jgi:hypothetical protein
MLPPGGMSMDEFRLLADRAGLGMSQQELVELKPIYDMYAQHAEQLHTIDIRAEEIVVEFHPDWPDQS